MVKGLAVAKAFNAKTDLKKLACKRMSKGKPFGGTNRFIFYASLIIFVVYLGKDYPQS